MADDEPARHVEVRFYDPDDAAKDPRRIWPESAATDAWDELAGRVRELCPGLCPNMLHADMGEGSVWATAHMLGGGDPDPVLRPKAKGPQAVKLLRKLLLERFEPGTPGRCGICGRDGSLRLGVRIHDLPIATNEPGTEDPDSALRPLALFTVNLTHRRCVMDRAVFACPLCRVLASPRAYQQMVCNHAILHMSDEAATGDLPSACRSFLSRLVGHFLTIHGLTANNEIQAQSLYKAAMDAASTVASYAHKLAGWQVTGVASSRGDSNSHGDPSKSGISNKEGAAGMNAREWTEAVVEALAESVSGVKRGKRGGGEGRKKGVESAQRGGGEGGAKVASKGGGGGGAKGGGESEGVAKRGGGAKEGGEVIRAVKGGKRKGRGGGEAGGVSGDMGGDSGGDKTHDSGGGREGDKRLGSSSKAKREAGVRDGERERGRGGVRSGGCEERWFGGWWGGWWGCECASGRCGGKEEAAAGLRGEGSWGWVWCVCCRGKL